MTSGTMHMNGHRAGAARLHPCAAYLAHAAEHAVIPSITTLKWLGVQVVSPVFDTDRPIPRPLERSP